MSSELVKKLEDREQTLRENLFYESAEDYDQGYLHGFFEAMAIVEQHEAQQMKEPFYRDRMLGYIDIKIKLMTASKSPMDEHDKGMLNQLVMMKNWLTEWAIENKKLKEEK